MRQYLLTTAILTAMLPLAAHAQNYVAYRDYGSRDVTVNMDVLGQSGMLPNRAPMPGYPMPSLMAPAIVTDEPLPLNPSMQRSLAAQRAPAAMPPMAVPSRPVVPQAPAMPSPIASRSQPTPAALPPLEDVAVPPRQEFASLPSSVAVPSVPALAPAASMRSAQGMTSTTALPHTMPGATAPMMDDLGSVGVVSKPSVPMVPSVPNMPSPIQDKSAILPPPALPPEMDMKPVAAAKSASDNFEAYRLVFDPNSDALKPSEQAVLNKIIDKMKTDNSLRLQMQAYANGTPETGAAARRMSLTRAMKVRSYLVDKGIVATRLDVRAMGMGNAELGDAVRNGQAPADRVDVIFARS